MKLLGKRCYKCRVIVRYVDKNSTLSRHRWSNSNYLHFHSLGSARDTFGTCLTDMSTLFMCSSCFLSTISGEGQQSHVWINMLPTLDRLLWKLHERRRWKESNLKAGRQKKKKKKQLVTLKEERGHAVESREETKGELTPLKYMWLVGGDTSL